MLEIKIGEGHRLLDLDDSVDSSGRNEWTLLCAVVGVCGVLRAIGSSRPSHLAVLLMFRGHALRHSDGVPHSALRKGTRWSAGPLHPAGTTCQQRLGSYLVFRYTVIAAGTGRAVSMAGKGSATTSKRRLVPRP